MCNRIFSRCILNHKLNGGSVIIVCSQAHLLHHFDQILYLEGGRVAEQGSFNELMQAGGLVAALVNDHVHKSEHSEPVVAEKDAPTTDSRIEQSNDLVTASALAHKKEGQGHNREARASGSMGLSVYSAYFKAMGWWLFATIIVVITIAYALMGFNDMWLTIWIQAAAAYNSTEEVEAEDELPMSENLFYGGVFIGGSFGYTLLVWVGSALYTVGGFRASQALHSITVSKVLYAPFSWFQDTPIGRITSRYTTDLSSVDQELSLWLDNLSQLGTQLLAMAAVMIYIIPPVAVPIAFGLVVYQFMSAAVNRTNRECKREANTAMGPVQSNAVEALRAKELARSMGCTSFFFERHHRFTNEFNASNFSSFCLMSWMQMVGVFISLGISLFTGTYVVLNRKSTNPERAALALTYSFTMPSVNSYNDILIF